MAIWFLYSLNFGLEIYFFVIVLKKMFLEYHLPTLQKRQTHQGPAGEVLAEER